MPKPAFVPGSTISSADVNSDFSDIATALTGSIAANGETPITGTIKFIAGTPLLPGISFTGDETTGIYYPGVNQIALAAGAVGAILVDTSQIGVGKDGSILRYVNGAVIRNVGEVTSYAGTTAPAGWFLCFGQAISRTSYPELFFVCGTQYGSGDGSTTFNLPDLRGRTVYGRDDMGGSVAGRITAAVSGVTGTTLGAAGGAQSVTIATTNLPAYTPSGSVGISDTRTWVTNPAVSIFIGSGGPGNVGGGANATSTASIAVTVSGGSISASFSGNAQGGASTPLANLSPGMILNKIIFAGRA